jgi:PEP-CTERM motif
MRKLVLSLLGASAALGMASAANAQLSIIPPTTVGDTTPVTGSVNFTSTYSDQSAQTPFELLVSFMIDQAGVTSFTATTTQNPDPFNPGAFLPSSDVTFTGGWVSGLCSSPQPNPADATCSGLTHLGDLNFTSPDGGITENGSLVGLFLEAGSYTFHLSGTRGAESSFSGTLNYAAAPAVPEPATWAMMLLGFGAVGWQMRRRRAPLLAQAA